MDEIILDTRLKAKWNGMKNALIGGDIEGSLGYIVEHRRELYRSNLQLLSSHLTEISATLKDIELDQVTGRVVEYEMLTEFQGQATSFLVRFVKDRDGIWRIDFF
jgi:hypothetical protein